MLATSPPPTPSTMRLLLTPYDLATCSIAARGALLLGCDIAVAFPPVETLSTLGANAPRLIDDALGWLTPLLRDGLISFDEESAQLWRDAVETHEQLSDPEWFGSACPREDPTPTHDERTRRMVLDILHGGREEWSRLAMDISAERYAQAEGVVLARVRANSRSAKIEQTLATTACRFSMAVPAPADHHAITEWQQMIGGSAASLNGSIECVIDAARENTAPTQATLDALRSVAEEYRESAELIASERGCATEMASVTCVRYTPDITFLAAQSAMGAWQRVPSRSGELPALDPSDGAFALVFKAIRIRA